MSRRLVEILSRTKDLAAANQLFSVLTERSSLLLKFADATTGPHQELWCHFLSQSFAQMENQARSNRDQNSAPRKHHHP